MEAASWNGPDLLGVLIHMRSLPHQEAQLETWEVGPGGVGGWSPTFLTAVS